MTPKRLPKDTLPESLKKDLGVLYRMYEFSMYEFSGNPIDTTIIPSGTGIMNDRIVHLISNWDTIPDFIDELTQLEWLWIGFGGNSNISELPTSLANLKKLYRIRIERCSTLQDLPMELTELENLRIIEIIDCIGFKKLPEVLYHLEKVDYFRFTFHWVPSQREKDWALKRMFNGDQEKYSVWLNELTEKYGTK